MGYSLGILNNIRANASQEYQNRIPEATQNNFTTIGVALEQYDLLYTEFFPALFGKIGKTIIEQKLFKNKLARFKSGTISTQQDVEEIFIEMAKAEGSYNPQGPNPLGRRPGPDVKTLYHRMNRQDYYAITVGDLDVVRVFRSEATLDNFIKGLINSVYSGASYDEWLAMKNLIASYDGYFNVAVYQPINPVGRPALTTEDIDAYRFKVADFVKSVRKVVQDMSFASTQFNAAGVMTWTNPEDLVFLVNKDILVDTDVEVLSKAFNMGKTDIQVEIIPMDDFGSLENTYGILVDKDWFRVWDTLSKMEPQRNAQGLFTNYFYHVHQILSASKFKNAVRFTTDTSAVTE